MPRRKTSGGGGDIFVPLPNEFEVPQVPGDILKGKSRTMIPLQEEIKAEPVPPYRILVKGNPEFEEAISLAPKLSIIQSDFSKYDIDYLMKAVRCFSYDDCHKAYITDKMESTCFVYVVSQLRHRLEKEIENIQKNSESLGYAFSAESGSRVIGELKKYIDYFDKNNTGWDRINTDFITAIFN